MGNRESELKTLQLKQSKLKDDIEAETQRLLDEREKLLVAVEADYQAELDRLRAAYPSLKEEIKQEQIALATVQSEITGAKAELWKHQEALTDAQAEVVNVRGLGEIYTAKLSGAQAQITDVSLRIAPLHAEKLDLTEQVKGARIALNLLETETSGARNAWEAEKIEHERMMHNLDSRAAEVSRKIQEDEKSWERTRQDLADRTTKLNKREETLERRELKVTRDERNLARNSELMNL